MRKCHIQLKTFSFAGRITGETGPVNQIVQPVALPHQTCSQAWRDIPQQSPCDITSHRASPLLSVQGDTHQTGIRSVAVWRRSAYTASTPEMCGTNLPVYDRYCHAIGIPAGAESKNAGGRMLTVKCHRRRLLIIFRVNPPKQTMLSERQYLRTTGR